MNQKRYISTKRPHSTNMQGARAAKISSLETNDFVQNQNVKCNTQEGNKRNKQIQIITQVQKKNAGTNFYQQNENNDNFVSITSQDNQFQDEYRNVHLKSVMFSQDSQQLFDGNNFNHPHNSLQMSTGFIEPPNNLYTDASFVDEHRGSNKYQQNHSNIVQSHQSRVQKTNAFHTKIPPKKQNQTQMLIKYINNEGQSLNIKQIERTNLIQQHHFYDDLFMGNQKIQDIKNSNNKDSANKQTKNSQMINVQNFNKSFYVQVNVSQQLCNKRNSVDSNLVMAAGDQGKQCISEQVNTQSTAKNLLEYQNQNQTPDQFLRKGAFPGRKLSILNKETLNLIVKKLSHSMHQESRLSASSLNNSQEINLNQLGQQNKMQKVSQTNTTNFFNRNYSFQINNRAQTANKTSRDSQKQTCVKGISIKKYYRNKAVNNIIQNSVEDNINNLSLSILAPQQEQCQQQQRRQTTSQDFTERNNQHQYLESYQNLSQNQIENNFLNDQDDKDYQTNILSQEKELQTEENISQNQQINFLKGQAECYNSNLDLDQQITCFIKDPKYLNVAQQNKKKRNSSNFLSQSQTHRSKDSNTNKAQTSFNFYQSNQNQLLNSTGTNFKMNQSQLVEHSNHIERKLSNMSQDSHPYLETLVFGEFGTLESAVAKSNHQNKKQQLDFNEQEEQFQLNADDQIQQYPLSSRYAEKNSKPKSKNLNRKLRKADKSHNKQTKGLENSNGSETVCDLTSFNDDKSIIKNKKRCASAREQVFQSQILQNENLKDKFLKNLNLRGQRQVSQEDLRSVGSQLSFQEQFAEIQISQVSTKNNVKEKQNQENQNSMSQNNLNTSYQFYDDSDKIQQSNQVVYQKQPSNEYQTLLKVYERSLANRTIDKQEEEQLLLKNNCDNQNVTRRRSVLIVKKDNYSHLSENSENLSNLKQVYNNNQNKATQNQIKPQNEFMDIKNGTKLQTHTTIDNNQRQNTSTLNTDHQIISTQNTNDVNSRYFVNQTIRKQELNGIFLPYQKEEQQVCKTNSQQAISQKIIHSNFPQKINSKFLQQKQYPTNSQIFSFLLQKQNINQNLENSILAINQRNSSLNNSQQDINKLKQSNQLNYQQRGNSLNTSANFNHNLQQKDNQKQKSKKVNQPPYIINNKMKAYDMNNQDADELLQPWNDYTYVKYF
ncbi:endo-1,4-beta-xylanase xylA, putative (macronuclear) [Tetrahymena thermophila SB210]|uniref:Endo-1,4-beta-xylanase xylA, putative n=1 Tax=Tetrahymena thermophila (strain SB210) TaxID=312017 RepID=Q22S93_TETTS|nr:endo-1,4-beta-xylanase xylA, putative [Tetrahymena thermophila SB210]EAR87879.2 endo-1,4-beta-xylanase xylA, putative [Tetrahymena thermophila SB210]|eukprot:XP_001008124.2 endo-1,4-beta-xylanase xylA, putative [Tetrahymena thermophila SB210]